jgi:hypothetical protein
MIAKIIKHTPEIAALVVQVPGLFQEAIANTAIPTAPPPKPFLRFLSERSNRFLSSDGSIFLSFMVEFFSVSNLQVSGGPRSSCGVGLMSCGCVTKSGSISP